MKPEVTVIEQKVLDGVTVRLIHPDEQARFNSLIEKDHYLHNASWVGERLFYVAEYEGEWLALVAWNAAAYGLKAREDWIGWSFKQRKRRLSLIANNSRFLILPDAHYTNLAIGFPKRGKPRRYRAPRETAFFRLLTSVASAALESALLAWQDDRLGRRKPDDNVLAVDGKVLRSSQGVEVVSAYACKRGRWLGSEKVKEDSNEIPAAQALLARVDLENQRVTLDAMHTQDETARIIVQERGGDYLMTVKGNQPGIAEDLRKRRNSLQRSFSPSASGRSGTAVRNQSQQTRGS